MLGFAIRFGFRGARLSRMWRLLQHLPGLRTILWCWLWRRSVLWRTKLRGLSGFRHCGGGRSPLLPPRRGLLCRPHLLHLETRTLGSAERASSLDPRPLRRARRILIEQQKSSGFLKRSAALGPSVPNENAQPWPGSPIHSAHFCGN
jgi:hypothetical protein